MRAIPSQQLQSQRKKCGTWPSVISSIVVINDFTGDPRRRLTRSSLKFRAGRSSSKDPKDTPCCHRELLCRSIIDSQQKRKRKNVPRRHFIDQPNDCQEPRQSIVNLYEGDRGRKCRIVSVPDTEEVQRERLARSNEDVNTEGQMRTMTVHRSMMDSDTAHIDNEVEISAQEHGLTIDD
jgi:hypothetical protein